MRMITFDTGCVSIDDAMAYTPCRSDAKISTLGSVVSDDGRMLGIDHS